MTLKKHMPPHICLKSSAYQSQHYDFNANDWYKSEYGRQKVQGELEKITRYLEKGDIAEL